MKAVAASIVTLALIAVGLIAVRQRASQEPARAEVRAASTNEPSLDAHSRPGTLRLPLVSPKILVKKRERRLELYSNGEVVRVYRVGLGLSPVGAREREGDRRTPEGDYYVCVKNAKSQYYLSLGLSYPNQSDAERGLRAGLITRAQYNQIVGAIRRKLAPPQNTALGGQIFIHGDGSQSDWTWGCVALDNADMRELFDAVPAGTAVTIKP